MRVKLPKSLNDVESSNREPIDPGTYDATISNIVEKVGSNSGKPYLSLELTIVDEPFAGRKVFDNVSLAEKALWKLKQLSEATEVEIDDEFDTEDFLGSEVSIVVDIEQSKGYDPKNIVKRYQ